MKHFDALEKIKSLASVGLEPAPLVSIFVPLRGTYLPPATIFNGLVRSANLILQREGQGKVSLTNPDWSSWQNDGARTLAIYHAAGMTTLIPLAVTMEPRVVVANSFHVKPLIASSQIEAQAHLLTLHRGGCSLHRVSLFGAHHLETYVPAKFVKDESWLEKISRDDLREFLGFLQTELKELAGPEFGFLAVDCPAEPLLRSPGFWSRFPFEVKLLPERGTAAASERSVELVQALLEEEVTYQTHGRIHQLIHKAPLGAASTLETLGEHIMNKKITYLLVSLEDLHFGEFDSATGKTRVHRGQRGTGDDDLLDDFAELALQNGIKVEVVPRKFLPTGRSFIVA